MMILVPTFAQGDEKVEIYVQSGHTSQVSAIAFHPDGKRIFTGSLDKTIKVWEIETGREVKAIRSHEDQVYTIAISRDGRYLASGGHDRAIIIWDLVEGKELKRLSGHGDSVRSLAYAPDGKFIVSGSSDKTVKIWDFPSGTLVRTLQGHSNFVQSVAISPRGKYILSGGSDDYMKRTGSGVLILWDMESGEKVREFKYDPKYGDIETVGFLSERYVFSLSDTLRIWDAMTGREVKTLGEPGIHFYSAAVDREGRKLVVGGLGEIFLWDMASDKLVKNIKGDFGAVDAVTFSPKGEFFAIGDVSRGVRIFDAKDGVQLKAFGRNVSTVFPVSFSPDGRSLLAGSADGLLKLWDVNNGRLMKEMKGHKDWVLDATFFPNGKKVVSCSGSFFETKDPSVRIWDVNTGQELSVFYGHKTTVRSVTVSSDGRLVISAGWDGTLKVWDASNNMRGIPVGEVEPGAPADRAGIKKGDFILAINDKPLGSWPDFVSTVRENPGRKIYFTVLRGKETFQAAVTPVGEKGRVGIALGDMSIKTLHGHSSFVHSVAISSDGKFLASGSADKTVKIWDLMKGTEIRTFSDNKSGINCLIFSPDGRQVASGGYKTITLREVAGSGEKVLSGHSDWINSLAFSPDGKLIASGSLDGTVKLWDTQTGEEIKTLRGHENQVWAVSFSPDGRRLASTGDDGVRLWQVESGQEIARLISFKGGEWIVVTPEGYYNASPGGDHYLNVRVGERVFGIDNYREAFFRPDLVKVSLVGKTLKEFKSFAEVKMPPSVEIIDTPTHTDKDELRLTLKIKDQGGGIGDIRIYLNETSVIFDGSRAIAVVRREDEKALVRTYSLKLLPGENVIQAVAFNGENTMQSNPALHRVVANISHLKKPALYGVAIGINHFKNPKLELKYATADAELFAGTIREVSAPLFEKVEMKVLSRPEETTKESIKKTLLGFRSMNPDDVFVFYVASHGTVDEGEFFLITSNVGSVSTARLREDAITQAEMKELIANIPSTKKFIVIDTCNAGKLGEAIQVAMLSRGMSEETAMKILSRAVGSTVLSASTGLQEAIEGYNNHGLFTYVLAEGLRGKADYDGDGFIKTAEIANYVDSEVPTLAEKVFKRAQYPIPAPSGQSFPLGKVRR
ncbi:MAG TPA: caspase family protein [Syntrophales bacterium]|nr:caspase family protein [Syntrophales bacterium]